MKKKETRKLSEIRKERESPKTKFFRKVKNFFIAIGVFFVALLESCAF